MMEPMARSAPLRLFLTFFTVLTIAVVSVWNPAVSAHVLKTDGDFRTELHIEPYDHPLSNTPVHYNVTFEEAPSTFSLDECLCQVRISNSSDVDMQKALANTSVSLSKNVVVFPKAGDYSLQISGSPKQVGSFQPFSLTYSVHVGQGVVPKQPFPPLLAWGIGIAIGGIMLAAVFMERSKSVKK